MSNSTVGGYRARIVAAHHKKCGFHVLHVLTAIRLLRVIRQLLFACLNAQNRGIDNLRTFSYASYEA